MKKFKYIFIFISIIFLSGCGILNQEDNVEIEIDNNIEISISDYYDFNWSKVIKIRYQGKIVDFTDADVKLISGDIEIGETCTFEVTYKYLFKTYKEQFSVFIKPDKYEIKDLTRLNNKYIALSGTVSLSNEIGFILTDETGSTYVKYQYEKDRVNKGDTVYIEGRYIKNPNQEFLAYKVVVNDLYIQQSIPKYLDEDAYKRFNNNYNYEITHVSLFGKVVVLNNEVFIKIKDYKLAIDNNATEEKLLLLANENNLISLTGWIYKKDEVTNRLTIMIEQITSNANEVIGNIPTIDTLNDYYYFTDINSVGDLKDYFKVTDKEDGIITIKDEMITASLSEGKQNIVTLTVKDSDSNISSKSIIIEINNSGIETYESIKEVDEYALPSTGDVEVLVIPISFPNYPATPEMLNTIEKAFFGTEADTGWESLNSYYKKSSYNKLNIEGDVTDWYTPKKSQAYYAFYEDDDNYLYGSTKLMTEALAYFNKKYDYSKYDSNNDGYIDAVYMVYNCPIGGNKTALEENFYWAFTYWDLYADDRLYQDTKGYGYVFMGYDFFLEDLQYQKKEIAINTQTLIHETGHLFNLEDYYDYDEEDSYRNDGGYCGADMMDYNIGDHSPISKILLDWVDPIVIKKSGIYQLPSFTLTGTTFLISANNSFSSIFDEYYLIDYYTFDGLNELELKSFFNTNKNYAGVRVSHVDASLTYQYGYFPTFTYNNTDTKHKFVQMLEADYQTTGIFSLNDSTNTGATLSDFYQIGSTFGTGLYEYYNSHKGTKLPFTMKVLDINDEYATLEIIIK